MNKSELDKEIILYLDRQLSPDQEREFEKELSLSPELREKLNELKNNFKLIKKMSVSEIEEDYLINTIPRFRQRSEVQKSNRIPLVKYITIFSGAVIVVLAAFLFFFNNNENYELQNEFEELNSSEIDIAVTEYSVLDNLYSLPEEASSPLYQTIDSVMVEEMISYEGAENYLALNDFTSVFNDLSDEESEIIYQEIINKDILNGDL